MKAGDCHFKLSSFDSGILSQFSSVEGGDGLERRANLDTSVTCL